MNVKNRTLFCHDNLEVLQGMNSESVDLIYLDPPFNKKKIFTAPVGSSAEGASFKDWFREEDVKSEWVESIKQDYDGLYNFLKSVKELSNIVAKKKNNHYLYNYCYLVYMAMRLLEMRRILKDTGSIYLHCDNTMGHYIKILMDIIFGEKNFRNEIVWKYNWASTTKKSFAKKKDNIFFYSKTENYIFNTDEVRIPYSEKQLKGYKKDDKGYYTLDNKNKNKKWYAHPKGQIADDTFFIGIISRSAKERVGYPTQKPLVLLERIIKASSNEGDMVLDPFCGCATTCVAAEKLGRKWIGIDVSVKAYELVKDRLRDEVGGKFDFDNNSPAMIEPEFKTDPPKRTDEGTDDSLKKYVYVISHPTTKFFKVGIAKDIKSRLSSYQTACPDRKYKLEHCLLTPYFQEIEKYIHGKYKTNLLGQEWVNCDLEKLKGEIEKFKK